MYSVGKFHLCSTYPLRQHMYSVGKFHLCSSVVMLTHTNNANHCCMLTHTSPMPQIPILPTHTIPHISSFAKFSILLICPKKSPKHADTSAISD
jgi:hypothetical protein